MGRLAPHPRRSWDDSCPPLHVKGWRKSLWRGLAKSQPPPLVAREPIVYPPLPMWVKEEYVFHGEELAIASSSPGAVSSVDNNLIP